MKIQQHSRRTFLRGVGVTMALPWMESIPVWGAATKAAVNGGNEAPLRFGVLFSGNGFHTKHFWAEGEGSGMRLGRVLEPLNDFREKLTFVRGLYNEEALKGNIHSSQTGNLLSGAPLESGGGIRSGTSVDQVIAQRYGRSTKVPSLVLGCERSNPGIHKNYSMLYSSHISWSSPTAPTPLELYPALAFDRLFKDEVERGDRSVLDAVLEEAHSFRRSISSRDQYKLDEYLNSVREVEQRIERSGHKGELQGWRPTLDKPNIPRPPDGIPQDLEEHMRLMCDIVVLGFQTDATRVCTLKLNNDHSYLLFRHLGVDVGHHELSHRDNEKWLRVNQFLPGAVRLHRPEAGPDPGGRADGAGQLGAHVLLEHAHGPARRHAVAGGASGRRWGPDSGGTDPGLPGAAQPEDVQPLPVVARQVRHPPGALRRLGTSV